MRPLVIFWYPNALYTVRFPMFYRRFGGNSAKIAGSMGGRFSRFGSTSSSVLVSSGFSEVVVDPFRFKISGERFSSRMHLGDNSMFGFFVGFGSVPNFGDSKILRFFPNVFLGLTTSTAG